MRIWRFTPRRAVTPNLPVHPPKLKQAQAKMEVREHLLGDDPLEMSELVRSDLWRRCTYLSMQYMPAVVDNSFARSVVTPDVREQVHTLTNKIIGAMAEDVMASKVLSRKGKEAIVTKLRSIRARVGMPWDLHGDEAGPPPSLPYNVDPKAPLVRNAREARRRNVLQGMVEGMRSHGRAPTERPKLSHMFDMPTSSVNAYYDPSSNQIFFLAGILTPPFFSPKYSAATQFAALGAVIGHELAHAFDNMGRRFTQDGSVGNFLPKDVLDRYTKAEECFVGQYSKVPTPLGNKVDGTQTLGENMADVMGLRAAYRALWNEFDGKVPIEETRDFVEVYAQLWCSAANKRLEAARAESDPHAPAPARINGALRNLVDPAGEHILGKVYDCQTGTGMHPKTLCSVW